MSAEPQLPAPGTVHALTPGEVARAFRVDSRTVSRWAKEGRISSFRTPGGHRRFLKHEVDALLAASTFLAH
ncbi:BldC family transcriptional regulator [Nocardiopsis lucentensis]|uniref:BldC family transcriptional regulator n=1 Tax=Nocardiopsis lucentensis TaxID=53441 RepID=UPI00034A3BAB|nr:BldC family transcriptional regulator [Nocardiopsis lucentensis]